MSNDVLVQPNGPVRLGDFLKQGLSDRRWTEFRAAVAFVKRSGTKHIHKDVSDFATWGKIRISLGIDAGGTSVDGLIDLLESINGRGEIWIFHNANTSTLHPKVYLFRNDQSADIVIGSGNLTEGGLYTNYEAGVRLVLDLANASDAARLAMIEAILDSWSHSQDGLCHRLDLNFLEQLTECENVPTEAESWETEEMSRAAARPPGEPAIFKRVPVPKAPRVPGDSRSLPDDANQEDSDALIIHVPEPAAAQPGKNQVFLMTMQRTDVGVGQTTKGTSRRSPEIFIPLAARDADPTFWGWPDQFAADPSKPGKMDRIDVKMRIGTTIFGVNMMTWPDKHDFRLRSEYLRSSGNVGDILYMERSDGAFGFTYYVEVVPKGSARHGDYLAQCVNTVRNSQRLWGYI